MKKHKKKHPWLEINKNDIKVVSIAGLCHDLGHGPFSHVFDNHFLRSVLPSTDWTHEWASTKLLEYMIEQSGSSDTSESDPIDLSQDDVRLICDLIVGETRGRSDRK
jgi:HD superfamily phosphohydrolase